jgi:hypothetical protein
MEVMEPAEMQCKRTNRTDRDGHGVGVPRGLRLGRSRPNQCHHLADLLAKKHKFGLFLSVWPGIIWHLFSIWLQKFWHLLIVTIIFG